MAPTAVTLSLGAEGECLGLAVRRAGPPAPGPGGQGDGESKHLPHVRTQGPLSAESVEGSATEEVFRRGPHPDEPVAKLLAANAGALGSVPGKGTGSCSATAKDPECHSQDLAQPNKSVKKGIFKIVFRKRAFQEHLELGGCLGLPRWRWW